MQNRLKQLLVRLGPRHPLTRTALHLAALRTGNRLRFHNHSLHLHQRGKTYILPEKHFTYLPMLFARASQYFDPVLPDSPDCYDYSVPAWHRYARSGLSFFLPSFPEDDNDASIYTRQYRPAPGDVIWDVGAHAGVSSYFFSKLVGNSGKVFAWEPDQTNHACLLENIAHHHLENVIPVKKALAGVTGKTSFQSEGTMGSSLADLAPYQSSAQIVEVETISLEDACRAFGTPRFIKMDIEGSEKQVLETSLDFLAREPGIEWSIEAHPLEGGRLSLLDMEELFPKAGYTVNSEQIEGYYFCWASRPRARAATV